VLSGRGLCDGLITRAVLPTVVCRCVGSRNLVKEDAMPHWGLSRQKQTKQNSCSVGTLPTRHLQLIARFRSVRLVAMYVRRHQQELYPLSATTRCIRLPRTDWHTQKSERFIIHNRLHGGSLEGCDSCLFYNAKYISGQQAGVVVGCTTTELEQVASWNTVRVWLQMAWLSLRSVAGCRLADRCKG